MADEIFRGFVFEMIDLTPGSPAGVERQRNTGQREVEGYVVYLSDLNKVNFSSSVMIPRGIGSSVYFA
jgi:hypothetical protein